MKNSELKWSLHAIVNDDRAERYLVEFLYDWTIGLWRPHSLKVEQHC